MLKTEDEARKCWCPFARVIGSTDDGESGAGNRIPSGDKVIGPARCIASKCMAWRVSYDPDGDDSGFGYCGLAGNPED